MLLLWSESLITTLVPFLKNSEASWFLQKLDPHSWKNLVYFVSIILIEIAVGFAMFCLGIYTKIYF